MNENTYFAFCWLCSAGVLIAAITALGYNYYAGIQLKETLIGKYGIDPVILECVMEDDVKNSIPKFILCQEAFKQYKVTPQDITKFRKAIDQ